MEPNSVHSLLWKRNKKAKADEIASWVPRDQLRPKDKPTRLFMDNEYVNCGYLAGLPRICTAVYTALLFHCNTETQSAFPSIKTLQDHIGEKNPNTVATAIQILEHYGIILVLRHVGQFGRSSLYVFQDVRHWKPVDKTGARIKINGWQKAAYQKTGSPDINSASSDDKIDTLTNLNKNYPKELTNRMRSLSDQMNINKKPERAEGLAIQDLSRDSVARSAYEREIPPWRRHMPSEGEKEASVANTTQMQREGINFDTNLPDNTEKIQAGEDINIDINVPVKTGKKRAVDDINLDMSDPFKNGEKWTEEAPSDLHPGNIRNEDLSAGTAE